MRTGKGVDDVRGAVTGRPAGAVQLTVSGLPGLAEVGVAVTEMAVAFTVTRLLVDATVEPFCRE